MKALRERLQKESQELKERLRKQAADLKEKMKLISEKAKNRTAELHDLHEAMNSTAEGSSQVGLHSLSPETSQLSVIHINFQLLIFINIMTSLSQHLFLC